MKFDKVSMLVPYTPDKGQRDKNWNWLKQRYEMLIPDVEICIGECANYPYSRSEAINNAVKKSTRDIFIITDADILFNIEDIELCIEMLEDYKIVYAISRLIKLNETITNDILSKPYDIEIKHMNISESNSKIMFDKSKEGEPVAKGGICLITRETFKECGGFDERFRGWGGEDNAFATIIKHLYKIDGRPDDVNIYHLYHDKQPLIKEYYTASRNLLVSQYWESKDIQATLDYVKSQNTFLY